MIKALALALFANLAFGQELLEVPIRINFGAHKGFEGFLRASISGTKAKARVQWEAEIKNVSIMYFSRVEFCIEAKDSAGLPIRSSDDRCAFRLDNTWWEQGKSQTWQATKVKSFGASSARLKAVEFEISIIDIQDPYEAFKKGERPKIEPSMEKQAAAQANRTAVNFNSDPLGAEIFVDGNFVGSTPSVIKVPLGRRTIRISLPGYQDWVRTLGFIEGEAKSINAVLAK